jgi:hypothetical protein
MAKRQGTYHVVSVDYPKEKSIGVIKSNIYPKRVYVGAPGRAPRARGTAPSGGARGRGRRGSFVIAQTGLGVALPSEGGMGDGGGGALDGLGVASGTNTDEASGGGDG